MKNRIRPLSPHITIYKPQISSMLSITHRITGILNFLGMASIIWWITIIGAYGFLPDNTWLWYFFQTYIGVFYLMGLTFSLLLHLCTGIRHLFWDIGKGFGLHIFPTTGWLAVTTATILWSALWILILYMKKL